MFHRFLFWLYRLVYRYDNWMRRHFTFTGHLVLSFTIASAVFGIDTGRSSTYQLFVFLLILVIFSLLGSVFNRLKVNITRQLPRYGTVGEPLNYSVTLNNQTKNDYSSLALVDQLAETLPTYPQLRRFYQLGQKPWYKRVIGYRQWLDFIAHQRGGILVETPLPLLQQTPVSVKLSFTPLRRGTVRFATAFIAKPDLLGLFRRLIPLEGNQSCLILPKRYPIRPLNLAGKRKYQAGGVQLANSVGNSSEFMSLRDYHHGDPLNSVHWKSFAKHGRLIVKEYQDEYFVRRALVLDTFIGTASPAQFEAAVSVAASIAISEQQNEALLDLMFVGQESYCFTTGRSVDQLPHLQEILASVEANHDGSFLQLHQAVMARLGLLSSLVCVLLDWDETRQAFIKLLRSHELPVAVFLLHDGSITQAQCANKPEHFYLLDYHHLGAQLADL